jgi:hypothetical protein
MHAETSVYKPRPTAISLSFCPIPTIFLLLDQNESKRPNKSSLPGFAFTPYGVETW